MTVEAAHAPPGLTGEKMSERDEIRRLGVAIRKKCLDCCCGMIGEVKGCRIKDCPLWPYRLADGEKRETKRTRGQIDIFSYELGVRRVMSWARDYSLRNLITELERDNQQARNDGSRVVQISNELVDEFILPLLRSFVQAPARLLSMEEVAATQGAGVVWVERLTKEPVISLYIYESSDGFAFVNPDDFNVEYQKDFFNRSWRVWDRKPTDEEREAVKWDAEA